MTASDLWADLSNNDPAFDPREYRRAGHLLIGWKATQGSWYVDHTHADAARRAHAEGLVVAHYHFAEPQRSGPRTEARAFWQQVRPTYRDGDYLVLDLERGKDARIRGDVRTLLGWCAAFARELRKLSGHWPILYVNLDYLLTLGRMTALVFPRRVWLAQYAEHATPPRWARPLWAWQRTDGDVGRPPFTLPGCPRRCDVNVLNARTFRRLRSRAGA